VEGILKKTGLDEGLNFVEVLQVIMNELEPFWRTLKINK
jgi:hypothetical protein